MAATDYNTIHAAPVSATPIGPVLSSLVSGGTTTVTTYFYRATDGSRGSTTSEDSIPAGAVVEGISTS